MILIARKLSAVLICLCVTPSGFAQDFAALERKLAEADKLYEEALEIYEKSEKKGGLMRHFKVPYKKQMKGAKTRYFDVMGELSGYVSRRGVLAEDVALLGGGVVRIDRTFAEDVVSAEITMLPQILQRNLALALRDASVGDDLFLPPLLILPKKRYKKYKKALGSVPAPAVAAEGAPVPAAPEGETLDKTLFYGMLNSPGKQREVIDANLAGLQEKIAGLEAASGDAAAHYELGNAYLMQQVYRRLDAALDAYREAQTKIRAIASTKTFGEVMRFQAKLASVGTGPSLPEDIYIEELGILKEVAYKKLEVAKVPLPEGVDDSGKPERMDGMSRKLEKIIRAERIESFNEYRSLADRIHEFTLLDPDPQMMAAFEKAAELDEGNVKYRLRLASLYRIQALRELRDLLWQKNQHGIGTRLTGFPKWWYEPKNKKEKIDLSSFKESLRKAISAHESMAELSPRLAGRGLGLLYLGLTSFDPAHAHTALSYLDKAGDDAGSLLAREYASYFVDQAFRRQKSLKDKELKNVFEGAAKAYAAIPEDSPLKAAGAALLSEGSLAQVFSEIAAKGNRPKKDYDKWVAKLERVKAGEPNNPYIYLLQGHLTHRKGTVMSGKDALVLIGKSFAMMGTMLFSAVQVYGEMHGVGSTKPDGTKYTRADLERYTDQRAKELEASFSDQSADAMFVDRYDPRDFHKAAAIYKDAISKSPGLGMGHYYLGQAYSTLKKYYSVKKQPAKAKEFQTKARESFRKFVRLSAVE